MTRLRSTTLAALVIRPTRTSNARTRGIAAGYRSGLEETVGASLQARGVKAEYEKTRIEYHVDEVRRYTPDWQLPNGIFIETKGRFLASDRKKHLLVQEQHPHLDIRFVFQRAKNPITKGSSTTYADWCDKHHFKWAEKDVPQSWINEKKAT